MKNALIISFSLLLIGNPSGVGIRVQAANPATQGYSITDSNSNFFKGGGADDEKKKKNSKALKKARKSAKEAKYASKMSKKQVMMLAKVRNFFHDTFNTKPGRYRNFRKHRTQQLWLKSKS